MTSRTTKRFRKLLADLPPDVRKQAKEAYAMWLRDAWHGSLQFKQIHSFQPIFSVRVGLHWRAVCMRSEDAAIWFFIGSHADYDKLIAAL